MAVEPEPDELTLWLRRLGAEPNRIDSDVLDVHNYPEPYFKLRIQQAMVSDYTLLEVLFTGPDTLNGPVGTGHVGVVSKQESIVQVCSSPKRHRGWCLPDADPNFYVRVFATTFAGAIGMFASMTAENIRKHEVPAVVSAAVMGLDGKTYAVPRPQRHHHAIFAAVADGQPKPIRQEQQGFMLEDGSFASRAHALACAVVTRQLPYELVKTQLFSEDLW